MYQIGGPDAGRDGRPYVGMMRPIMSPTEPGQLTQYGALYTGTSTQVPTHRRSSVAQSKQAERLSIYRRAHCRPSPSSSAASSSLPLRQVVPGALSSTSSPNLGLSTELRPRGIAADSSPGGRRRTSWCAACTAPERWLHSWLNTCVCLSALPRNVRLRAFEFCCSGAKAPAASMLA